MKCKRGLRQASFPLPSFLFDLVTDTLHAILYKVKSAGYLQGLGNFKDIGNIFNLHFADDTLLFLQADKKFVEVLKWILIGFEDLSGLNINYAKSEMISFNI